MVLAAAVVVAGAAGVLLAGPGGQRKVPTRPASSGAANGRPADGRPANGRPASGHLVASRPDAAAQIPKEAPRYDPCPKDDGAVPGDGPSTARPVTIPALPPEPLPGPAAAFDPHPADVPVSFSGTMLAPTDTATYPGPRPAVLLFHGISGDQCQMWWLAQYLAGVGYVTLTVTSPTPPTHDASYGVAIDAARSAVAFVRSPSEDPFARLTDPTDIGLGGWSEGSVVASVAQGLPGMGAVRAIVALDDLRGSFLGDTGAPLTFCSPPVQAVVLPRVPALGFASDTVCDVEAHDVSPDIKLSGYDRWRGENVASVELPLAGYGHYDYDNAGPRLVPVAQLSKAWFDRWLLGQHQALAPFVACQLDGTPFPAALSSTFEAGAYLPGVGVDSASWASTLAARCHQNPAEVGTRPIPGP